MFLGREDRNSNIRVPIPREDHNGKVMWPKKWVANELMKKESQALGAVTNSLTLENSGASCGASSYASSSKTSSKGKGKADSQTGFQADS